MKLKINSKDFRVRKGPEVDLKKWPTKVDPVYTSKEQDKKLPEEHVEQDPGPRRSLSSLELRRVRSRRPHSSRQRDE
jgi:hypothetical protein